MIIVSDTTPLRYLIEIDEVHILQKLFGRVIIPERVSEELKGKRTPQQVKDWVQSPPEWIDIRKVDSSGFVPRRSIQEGEREAIAPAVQLGADVLLCDDNAAIAEAQGIALPTLRIFNILERAAQNDLLDLPKAVEKILHTTFHAPPNDIINAMLERDKQRRLPP